MNTRNKNTYGNYCLEQKQYINADKWMLYKNGAGGHAYTPRLAGNGFIQGRVPSNILSNNSTDIESFLRGTNLSNMVTPQQPLVASLTNLPTKNLFKTPTTIMPTPLVVPNNQRPFPI